MGIGVVYQIVHVQTGAGYVGSTVNKAGRFRLHRRQLSKGAHHARKLQALWDADGPHSVVFSVLEIVGDCSLRNLRNHERRWGRAVDCSLNSVPPGSGGKRPRREDVFTCRTCGKQWLYDAGNRRKHYCSNKCATDAQVGRSCPSAKPRTGRPPKAPKISKTCLHCGKVWTQYQVDPRQRTKFCSFGCYTAHRQLPETSEVVSLIVRQAMADPGVKAKISTAMRRRFFYITDGVITKKQFELSAPIPAGWRRGRLTVGSSGW